MKIQFCSDLHLEFPENNKFVNRHLLVPEGEILLLAGDILPLILNHRNYSFFDFAAANFEATYWVPGNHEYYGFDVKEAGVPLMTAIRRNVFLVNNQTIYHKGVNIICSTLWSHIAPASMFIVQKQLADFSAIKMNGSALLPGHFNQLHATDLSYIQESVNKHTASRNVVLTHHVPTLYHYPSKYRHSVLSQAFAVELHDYIKAANIGYWLYGHHHCNTAPFKIGNTELLTNQLGYVRKHEHGKFKKNAVFEI